MLRLYSFHPSGNCYKIRLCLAQLELEYELIELDLLRQEPRSERFRKLNPHGTVPLLQNHAGEYLAESGCILWYLAEKTHLLPDEHMARVRVLRWLIFEASKMQRFVQKVRSQKVLYGAESAQFKATWNERNEGGYATLGWVEAHLANHKFLVGEQYSIADISVYAYAHLAEEGGYRIERFPNLLRWLDRIRAQPGHIPLEQQPPGLVRKFQDV